MSSEMRSRQTKFPTILFAAMNIMIPVVSLWYYEHGLSPKITLEGAIASFVSMNTVFPLLWRLFKKKAD